MYAIQINSVGTVQQYRVYTLGQFAADKSLNTAPDAHGLYWVFVDEKSFLSSSEHLLFITQYPNFMYDAASRLMLQIPSDNQTPPGEEIGNFTIQEFTHPGTFNLLTPPTATSFTIEVLLGGGGGGGRSSEGDNGWCFSSGGAGGLVQNVSDTLTSSQTMTIVVGKGGSMETDGGSSSVSIGGTVIATATGGTGWQNKAAAPGGTPNGYTGFAGLTGSGTSLAGVSGADSIYGKGGAGGNPFATDFTPGYIDQSGKWVYYHDPDNSCYGGDATGYGAGGGSAGWRTGVIPIGWNNNGQICPSWCLGPNGTQQYTGYQWPGGKGSGGYVKIIFYFTPATSSK